MRRRTFLALRGATHQYALSHRCGAIIRAIRMHSHRGTLTPLMSPLVRAKRACGRLTVSRSTSHSDSNSPRSDARGVSVDEKTPLLARFKGYHARRVRDTATHTEPRHPHISYVKFAELSARRMFNVYNVKMRRENACIHIRFSAYIIRTAIRPASKPPWPPLRHTHAYLAISLSHTLSLFLFTPAVCGCMIISMRRACTFCDVTNAHHIVPELQSRALLHTRWLGCLARPAGLKKPACLHRVRPQLGTRGPDRHDCGVHAPRPLSVCANKTSNYI